MKVEVEILRTRTVVIDESCTVELDIPRTVLREYEEGDSSALIEWVEANAAKLHETLAREMEIADEDESIEYDSIEVVE